MGRIRQSQLSDRQRECLEGRLNYFTAKQIGRRLSISPHTVAMHWRLARLKLNAVSTLAAALHLANHDPESKRETTRDGHRRPVNWTAVLTMAVIGLGALLALLMLIVIFSIIVINLLSLNLSEPYYSLFD